jgi:hypothetical protein
MHALVLHARVDPGRHDHIRRALETEVIPQVQHVPGFVAAWWLATPSGEGPSILVFESEAAVRAVADEVEAGIEGVELIRVEVAEVLGHAGRT